MALTYEESYALMLDMQFRGRIQVAGIKYATSISDEPSNVTAHTSRLKWAQSMVQMPDAVAGQLQPSVVMDAAVQEDGADITDVALQGSVETVVNKIFI